MQQAWNYYDNGFRLLRLTSMLGIWCGVLLLLLADADAALSQSAGKKNGGIPALLQPRRSAGNKRTSDAPEQMLWTDFDYFDDASSNGDPTDFFEDRIHFGEPLLNHPEAYMNSVRMVFLRTTIFFVYRYTVYIYFFFSLHRGKKRTEYFPKFPRYMIKFGHSSPQVSLTNTLGVFNCSWIDYVLLMGHRLCWCARGR